jgi:DNA-binding FadR family transcriptional regulator
MSIEVLKDRPQGEKYAVRIAQILEDEILAAGWPVGRLLGKEEDIVARFSVGRWVVREAIALMERDGVVTMRRGPAGGLVVSEPAQSAVVHRIRTFLLSSRISPAELIAARLTLDEVVFRLAARNLDARSRATMLEVLNRVDHSVPGEELNMGMEFTRSVLVLTRNAPLQILAESVQQALVGLGMLSNFPEFHTSKMSTRMSELFKLRLSLVRTLLEQGLDATLSKLPAFGAAYTTLYAGRSELPRGQLESFFGEQDARMSELFYRDRIGRKSGAVALAIEEKIISADLAPGDFIGTEAELMKELGSGRGAMREAIRLLERDGLVVPSEGRAGGLCVGSPNPAATIRSCVLYLRSLRVPESDIDECLAGIELAVFRDVLQARLDLTGILERLENLASGLLDPSSAAREDINALYSLVADCSSNPVLALFIRILGRLVTRDIHPENHGNKLRVGFYQRIMALVAALRLADADLAAECLRDLEGLFRAYRSLPPMEAGSPPSEPSY